MNLFIDDDGLGSLFQQLQGRGFGDGDIFAAIAKSGMREKVVFGRLIKHVLERGLISHEQLAANVRKCVMDFEVVEQSLLTASVVFEDRIEILNELSTA